MKNYEGMIERIIAKSDIVLEILDARFIEKTRNKKVEERIKRDKILVHVINKCDFVDKRNLDKIKKTLENCVFVSAKRHLGTTLLKQKIKMLANKKKIERPIVGVIGYPNVGKSSLINTLKGRYSARTSSEAGFTKAEQHLRIGKDILMIDSPGVISHHEDAVLIGAENPGAMKDPDLAVIKLMKNHPEFILKKYGIGVADEERAIEVIALKLNLKKKGGKADIDRASRRILNDWIHGG
jgi:ribosome biogenesis GTPase A